MSLLPRELMARATAGDIAEIVAEYQLQKEEREHKKIMDEVARAHGEDGSGKQGAAFGRKAVK